MEDPQDTTVVDVEVVPSRERRHRAGRFLPTWSELAEEARAWGIDPEPFTGNRKVLWLALQGAKLYHTGARGMKPILDLDLIEDICEHIENGASIARAAGACGVSADAVKDWKAKAAADPDSIYGTFLSKVQQAEDKAVCNLLATVRTGDKTWRGSAWILERRFSKEFTKPAPILIQAHMQGGADGGGAPNLADLLKALSTPENAPLEGVREVRLLPAAQEPFKVPTDLEPAIVEVGEDRDDA